MEKRVYLFHGMSSDLKRFTVAGAEDGNTVMLGVSLCGNNDAFNKKLGATIAAGRLSKGKRHGVASIFKKEEGDGRKDFLTFCKRISRSSKKEAKMAEERGVKFVPRAGVSSADIKKIFFLKEHVKK